MSYEGLGAAQPTVGLRKEEFYTPSNMNGKDYPHPPEPITDFTKDSRKPNLAMNNGVYQKALEVGHKLGVFASSDHISTHTSFGGVYVESFTRQGIIDGFKARRTCAATDKIFVQLSLGDHLMGELVTVKEAPTLSIHVSGTAALKRVTLVRNEQDHHIFTPQGATLTQDWQDPAPLTGENRYYLRIEQADGNMAWSSPLWVTHGE